MKATKETPAEKRTRLSLAASQATDSTARRGEDDSIRESAVDRELAEMATSASVTAGEPARDAGDFPHQAGSGEPAAAAPVSPETASVTLGRELNAGLTYMDPPEGADVREQIAHHRRRIMAGNRGLTKGLGHLTRDWVLSAGEHFWAATTDNKALKTAGYKSVDEFAGSVDMTRDDVYRVRRAVPVYRAIGDLVEEPLNERTVRALYASLTDGKKYAPTPQRVENIRQQFKEMKTAGKVTSAGAVWARKLLELGPAASIEDSETAAQRSPAGDKIEKALKARRFVDLDLLKEAKQESPEIAQRYVKELREQYEAAAALLDG
ncbi:hypothetical protein [Streptomyces sp. cg35]|uniref:hypothetical protein n=1 Tax=Streptomyces sp. cg35 TaxID=3421650 RepID=UPI003D175743